MLSAEPHRGNREGTAEESYGRFLYNLHRYYDPSTGRYISADPIGQAREANVFTYAANNPLWFIDPLGLTSLEFNISKGTLRVDPEQPGREPYEIPATSGRDGCLNNPACTDKPWEGPVPPGDYDIDVDDISDPGPLHDWLRNRVADWGDFRAPMTPAPGTDLQGRDDFFLHGGDTPGSAGCIDVGGGEFGDSTTDQLLQDLAADPDGKVKVRVVPGGPGRPGGGGQIRPRKR